MPWNGDSRATSGPVAPEWGFRRAQAGPDQSKTQILTPSYPPLLFPSLYGKINSDDEAVSQVRGDTEMLSAI